MTHKSVLLLLSLTCLAFSAVNAQGLIRFDLLKKSNVLYTVSQEVPTFKLSVTLSNVNRFTKLLHCWKAYEMWYKSCDTIHAATLSWKIRNSIFSDSENMEKVQANCILSAPWVCCLSSWLRTKSLTVSTLSSVRALRGLAACQLCLCPARPQPFQQLINTKICSAFIRKFVSQPRCVPFKYKLLLRSCPHRWIPRDKHSSEVYCDEFWCYKLIAKVNK